MLKLLKTFIGAAAVVCCVAAPLSGQSEADLLVAAARAGEIDLVDSLLAEGADPNAADVEGWLPLVEAATKGHTDVVVALIEAGAELEAKDPDDYTALMAAAWAGHLLTLRALVERGANPAAHSEDGWTALMAAADEGRTPAVQMLLDLGLDPNASDEDIPLSSWPLPMGTLRLSESSSKPGPIPRLGMPTR
jgi:ankyrin repeat protein